MMETLVETYRGARIYEIKQDPELKDESLNVQLVTKGHIHHRDNFQKDFTSEAANRSNALQKIRCDIDLYLLKHKLNTFTHDG